MTVIRRQIRTEHQYIFVDAISHGSLVVSALDSGSSGPGSSPCGGHCVVF